MALSANTVWEVRTTGSDNNGGGYVSGGVDYSQQNAAQVTIDGATISAVVGATTTHLTITGYTPSANDVGNIVQITGGTATAGFYQIASISGADWVLDRSCGTAAQTATGAMGGTLGSPGKAGAAAVASNLVWLKSGTYSITSASTNVAGGCVSLTAANQQWQGYDAARGDLGTAPVLQASGIATATIVTIGANLDPTISNITVDGQSLASIKGLAIQRGMYYKVTALNCTNGGIVANQIQAVTVNCVVSGCSTVTAFTYGQAFGCVSHGNSNVAAFAAVGGGTCIACLAYGNTGAAGIGFLSTTVAPSYYGCTAYGNGSHGYSATSTDVSFVNCVAEQNSGWGWTSSGGAGVLLLNCAGFHNTSGNVTAFESTNLNFVAYGATAFVNAAGNNFSLNANNPGGAQLRAAGFPGTLPDGNVGYEDIGALRHQDAGGGGGGFIIGA